MGCAGPFTLVSWRTRSEGVPLWDELFHLPVDERLRRLADPDRRAAFRQAIDNQNGDTAKGQTLPPPHWKPLVVQEAVSPANQPLVGLPIAEIAGRQGRHPADVLFDI